MYNQQKEEETIEKVNVFPLEIFVDVFCNPVYKISDFKYHEDA